MMAFILATDFDFIAYMSKMAFFWKLFSRQWRFWNMIHLFACLSVCLSACIYLSIYLSVHISVCLPFQVSCATMVPSGRSICSISDAQRQTPAASVASSPGFGWFGAVLYRHYRAPVHDPIRDCFLAV